MPAIPTCVTRSTPKPWSKKSRSRIPFHHLTCLPQFRSSNNKATSPWIYYALAIQSRIPPYMNPILISLSNHETPPQQLPTPVDDPLFPQGLHFQIFTMTNMIPLAGRLTAYTFGSFCLLSALPFTGIPFPSRAASDYYIRKNAWIATLAPFPMTPAQAGYFGAVLRITLGLGLISQRYRMASLVVMGAVVGVGTVLAWRDGRPMRPQWSMLGYTAVVYFLNRRW